MCLVLAAAASAYALTEALINPAVREAEYAVRGRIPLRAKELEDKLAQGAALPFEKLVSPQFRLVDSHSKSPQIHIAKSTLLACFELAAITLTH